MGLDMAVAGAAAAPIGSFARLDETTFAGHVVSPDDPSRRFVVEILVDGEPVALLRAERFVHALSEAGQGDGCYGFVHAARRGDLVGCRRIEARLANTGLPVGDQTLVARLGAGDLGQSGVLGAGNEDEAGERRVSQRGDRPGIHGALFVQPRQWSQAGRVTFAVCEEVGP